MAAGTTFIATAPDGTIVERTSKTRTYAFAIVATHLWGIPEEQYGAIAFSADAVNAEKTANTWRRRGMQDVTVIPAAAR